VKPLAIMGIDASLTGLAMVLSAPQRPTRIAEVGSENEGDDVASRMSRLHKMIVTAHAMVSAADADGFRMLAVIEGYALASGKSSRNASHVTELGGVLRYVLTPYVWQWVEVPPASLKLYAAHNGRADKPEVIAACNARWACSFGPKDHNKADAFALKQLGVELSSYATRDDVSLQSMLQTAIAASGVPSAKERAKRRKVAA